MVSAACKRLDDGPNKNTGVPTVAVVVMVCVAVLVPLQPAALAVIIDVPNQPAVKVTSPVEGIIELPADVLVASSE